MLQRTLAKDPADRYQNAAELLDALYCLQLTNEHQADAAHKLRAKAVDHKPCTIASPQNPLHLPPSTYKPPKGRWLPLACAVGGVSLVAFMLTELMMRM